MLQSLYALELEFSRLSQQNDELYKSANWLAQFKIKRGDYNKIAQQLHLASADKDFINSCAGDEIRKRFDNGLPLSFDISGLQIGALAQSLLSSKFLVNIGMAIIGQPMKQQEVETQQEVHQPGIVKTNGVVKPPIESKEKLISVDQFQKLFFAQQD